MSVERKTGIAFLKALDGKGSGVAVIATLTPPGAPPVIDKDGDLTLPGAFGDPVVPFLVSHQWSQIPAGKAWIREEGDEAHAYFQLNLATSLGKDLYEAMRFDLAHPPAKMEMSYGFSIPPGGSEFRTLEDGRRVRALKHLTVHEVSSVILGAGIGTRLVAVKGTDETDLEQVLAAASIARTLARGLALEEELDEMTSKAYAFRYTFVDLSREDPRYKAALLGLKAAVAELPGAREPNMRFFREALPGESVDFVGAHPLAGASGIPAYPDVVAVHEKFSPSEILETVAHEVCHCARPGLSEEKVAEFGREIARKYDLQPAFALAPVPVFVTSEEGRECRRKGYPVYYAPLLNREYVLGLCAVPQSPRSKAVVETSPAHRLAPLSGLPSPGLSS